MSGELSSQHSQYPWREVPWDADSEIGSVPQYLREGQLPPPAGWLLHDHPRVTAPDSDFIPQPLRPVRPWNEDISSEAAKKLQMSGLDSRYDQENYFRHRRNTELWLWRHGTRRLGLPLKSLQPVYFSYKEQFLPLPAGQNKQTLGLALSWLPRDQMTFTIYDSFHNFAKSIGEPFENTPQDLVPLVLTWREINQLRGDFTMRERFMRDRDGPYIECQFWGLDHELIQIISGTKHKEGGE